MHLEDAGGHVYLFTTDLALDWGLIGSGEYLTRLGCLRGMVEPVAEFHGLVSERLGAFGEECPEGWPNEGEATPSSVAPTLEVHHEENDPPRTSSVGPGSQVLHLLTDRAGVLGERWLFHQYDDDFFPSVPHGHLQTKQRIKLDAYRGYTYDTSHGNTALQREDRDFIVGLWKSSKFRVFARKALDYFIAQHACFNWWAQRRILHPLRLPRY